MAEEQKTNEDIEPVTSLVSQAAENIKNENMYLAGQNFGKAQRSMKFSPEFSTSFFPGVLRGAVEKDIEEQKQPAPTVDLLELLGSKEPISVFSDVPAGIDKNQLSMARYYHNAKKNNLQINPEDESQYATAYSAIINQVNMAKSQAQENVPSVIVPLTDPITKEVQPKYDTNLPYGYRAYAKNRKRLYDFMNVLRFDKEGRNFLQTKPLAANVLQKHFGTGSMTQEIAREFASFGGGLNSMFKALQNLTADFGVSQARYLMQAEEGPMDYFRKKAVERVRENKQWLADSPSWLSSHTERLNQFVEKKFIEDNGQKAFDGLTPNELQELRVNDSEALALFNFAFSDQSFLEQIGTFAAVNAGSTIGLVGASRLLKLPATYAGYRETARNYYLRMDKERRAAGYVNLPTTEYIKFMNNSAYGKATGIKKLGRFFQTIRGDIKGEIGYFSVLNQEKAISQGIIKARDKAYMTLQAAQKSGVKSKINSAERAVLVAEDNYLISLMKNAGFDYNNNFIVPKQYLSKLAGTELFPSTIQSMTYSFFDRENDPSSLERAELYSALGYLTAATGIAGFTGNMLGNAFSKFEVFNDISYTTKELIDDYILVDRLGITLPKLLDPNVKKLQVSDVLGGPKRDITPSEYTALMQLKTIYSRLSPESQAQAEKNRKRLTTKINSIGKIMGNSPHKDFVLNALKLSFSEVSGIQAYAATGEKIATHLNFRDITKVSDRFLNSVKYKQKANDRMVAHSLILKELEEQFVGLGSNLSKQEKKGFTDVIDLILKTNQDMKRGLDAQKQGDMATLRALKAAFADGDTIKGKTPEQMVKIVDNLFETQKTIGTVITKPTMGYDEIVKSQDAQMVALTQMQSDLIENINTSIANYSIRGGNVNALTETGSHVFATTHTYAKNTGDILYSSLNKYPELDGLTVLNDVINLHKSANMMDGRSQTNTLAAFIPDGAFSMSTEGRELVGAINDSAERAMLNLFIKSTDSNLPMESRKIRALDNLDDVKSAINDMVRTKYGIQDDEAVGSIHYYDYFKTEKVNGQSYSIEPFTVSIKEMDSVYREIRDRGVELLKSNDSMDRANGAAYMRLANNINKKLLESPAGKDLQFTRLEHFARVGNKRKEGSFFGEYYNFKFSNKKKSKKDLIIKEAAGMSLLQSLNKNISSKKKLENLGLFKESVELEFGLIQFPKDIADPNDPTRLRRDLDLNEVLDNGKTLYDDIMGRVKDGEIPYVLDDTTELGQAGIKLMDQAMLQLFREANVYETNLKTIVGKFGEFTGQDVVVTAKGRPSGPTTTMFTRDDGLGLITFKEMKDALTFKLKSGKEHQVNIGAFVDQETDLRLILEADEKLAKQFDEYVRDINLKIEAYESKIVGKFNTDSDALQAKFKDILDYDPSKGGLLKNILGKLPPGVPDEAADINRLDVFERYYDRLVETLKNDKSIKATEEEVQKYMAGNLLKEIYEEFGEVRANIGTKLKGQLGDVSIMENPVGALQALENPTVRAMFTKLGVTENQYEAFLGITGHAVVMRHTGSALASGVNLPEVAISDTGIISRAFNYARGLVSKEYILVEAGFRIMRDNDMRMMDFILNDPDAADMFIEILSDKSNPQKVKYMASTFAEQMAGYIARVLAFTGQELEGFDTYEPINPVLEKEITKFENPGEFGGKEFPEIQQQSFT